MYLLASIRLLPSISFIITSLNKIAGLYSSADILYNDFKNFSKEKNYESFKADKKNLIKIDSIQMEDLSFRYKNSKDKVFEKINFNIEKNECIGIVGDSGSGKTTFVDILLGLLKPSGGKIYLNGKLLPEEFNLSGNIAYLPQEPMILEETIKINISLEKDIEKINEKKILQSIKRANLESVIFSKINFITSGFISKFKSLPFRVSI